MDASKAGQNTIIVTLLLALLTMQAVAQTRPAQKPRPVAEPQSRSADALQEAESLLQKQQYAEAETKLQSLTGVQAENPQVWFDLGFAESHLGKTTESISAYKKAAALSPKWFEASLNLGLALHSAAKFKQAIPEFDLFLKANPQPGPTHLLAGVARLKLDRACEAIPVLEKARQWQASAQVLVELGDA